jgi:protein-S-isoprenylcysteine O-methyltransferase Ste14
MAAVVRTVVYLVIIVGLVAIFLPAEVLERSGVTRASPVRIIEIAGATLTLAGVGLALWCAFTFAVLGRGTPLPFDPPRRLVIAGPYRWVRNPMAIGAGSALVGVGLFYKSLPFLIFAVLFVLGIHTFVVLYEEPTLRRAFGAEYLAYCRKVNRWLPHRPVSTQSRDGDDDFAA